MVMGGKSDKKEIVIIQERYVVVQTTRVVVEPERIGWIADMLKAEPVGFTIFNTMHVIHTDFCL